MGFEESAASGGAATLARPRDGGVSPLPSDLAARRRRHGGHGVAPNFTYQGGPIIADPQVYATFWGPSWSDAAHTTRRDNLIQFLQDFMASDYMNILSQYGVGNGAGNCGTWHGASDQPQVTGQLDDAGIHRTIQSMIDNGVVPEPGAPSNMALMIFLDETIEIDDAGMGVVMCEPAGDTAFGYHYFFTTTSGHQFYYSVVPALSDGCLRNSCPQDNACSLHLAETQEQRQTQVASHEFSEMVTDAEITAWRDPSSGDENGDLCNGQNGTITVSGRTWTVQKMYSTVDDHSGGTACILGPPNPIPSQLPAH